MEESFELPVTINGKHMLLPARLIRFGYSYRVEVDIEGVAVSFEKDEERNWRAMSMEGQDSRKEIDLSLLQAVVDALDAIG